MTAGRSYRLSARMRLKNSRQFEAVYDRGLRKRAGPLTVFTRPNDLDHPRLGLSVPRRVGTAVQRNLIKRRLREAFRLMQHDLPRGYDVVINVYPHEPMMLAEYQRLVFKTIRALHQRWQSKQTSTETTNRQAIPPQQEGEPRRSSHGR